MKTLILAGGKGTRYATDIPKPLAPIGDKAIIEHVILIYHIQGFNDFIIAVGNKKDEIINYFISKNHPYEIEFVDTGEDSNTAERIKQCESYLDEKEFFCTYADSLCNINLQNLYDYHITNKCIATLTAVKPYHQYGILKINKDNIVTSFYEKPRMNEYINGGFFVFNKEIFKYILKTNEDLEFQVLTRLVHNGELKAYIHNKYWDTLNTPKDEIRLNNTYNTCINMNTVPNWHYIK